jgi:hypothetical protein
MAKDIIYEQRFYLESFLKVLSTLMSNYFVSSIDILHTVLLKYVWSWTNMNHSWIIAVIKFFSVGTKHLWLVQWKGCAIAQEVSRWLPTAAARFRDQVRSCRIYGGWSGTGACFLLVLQLPLSIFIPQIVPQSPSSIIRGWYNRPVVTAVSSGFRLTPLIIIIIIIMSNGYFRDEQNSGDLVFPNIANDNRTDISIIVNVYRTDMSRVQTKFGWLCISPTCDSESYWSFSSGEQWFCRSMELQ